MTPREELLEALTVERFAPRPERRPVHVHTDAEAAEHLAELSAEVGGHLRVVEEAS